ncbi:hypothetical protein BVX99_01210 [bacterium F16]|nr:hypothetical protein BVX99_01210 [bacterium F16]
MKKMLKKDWTIFISTLIVAVLNFLPCEADNAAAEPQDRQGEVTSLREKSRKLEVALRSNKKELDRVREDFSDAYLQVQKLRKELDAIETGAALFLAKEAEDEKAATVNELVNDRLQLTASLKTMKQDIDRLRPFLKAILELKKTETDTELNHLIDGRLILLEKRLQALISAAEFQTPSNTNLKPGTSKVLDVNPELSAVILEGGRHTGIRIGSKWRVRTASSEFTLQILDVRLTRSVAIVLEGNVKELVVGAEATLELRQKAGNK